MWKYWRQNNAIDLNIKEVRKMKGKAVAVLMVLGAIGLLFCAGCGGGSRKISQSAGIGLSPSYSGPTGSVILHVVWPQRDSRVIPEEAKVIDIEVTGEGLPVARKAQIEKPETKARIDNLPIGQKGISATAREGSGGPALAFGFATTIVEPNRVKDVVITLQRIEQIGVASARALVQEARDAAITLGSGIANELVNQALVWQLDLVPTFALTMQRLDFVNNILTGFHSAKVDEEYLEGQLTDFPSATYKAHQGGWWWYVELEKVGPADPDTWVVQFPESDALLAGMTLTFKRTEKPNNLKINEWEFKVTSTTELQLLYEGRLTFEANTQNRVTRIVVNGTFKDKFLPDGITVNGTLTGTPLGEKSYTKVSFSGRIQSPKISLTVDEATATFNPPPDAQKWGNFLTKAELKNFKFKTQRVAGPIEVTGNLSVEAQIDDKTPEKGPLLKKGSFSGGYESTDLTFEGSIAFDWKNPQRELTEVPKGTATIEGRWAMRNRPIFRVKFSLTSASPFEVAIDITRGDRFLKGKLTGDWEVKNGDLKVTDWSLDLKNEMDLTVEFKKGVKEGLIKAPDGTKLADIQRDPDLDLLVVRYIDGTLESLEPTGTAFQPRPITGTVRGRVVDDKTGQPVADAWVYSGYDSTSTDAQGFFELRALAGRQTIKVWHWEYSSAEVEVDVPPRGIVTVPDIRLLPYPSIFGVVTDAATNNPIFNARVWLLDWISTWTDEQGHYRFTHLEPGIYTVRAEHDDYETAEQQVTLQAGEKKELNFRLTPKVAPLQVSGTVRDVATGQGIAKAVVALFDKELLDWTLTDEQGNYTTSVPPSTLHLAAGAQGYFPSDKKALAPVVNFDLQPKPPVSPAATLRGTVRDAVSTQGIANVVMFAGWENGEISEIAVTNEQGEYTMQVPAQTEIVVGVVLVRGYEFPDPVTVTTGEEGSETVQDFLLNPSRSRRTITKTSSLQRWLQQKAKSSSVHSIRSRRK